MFHFEHGGLRCLPVFISKEKQVHTDIGVLMFTLKSDGKTTLTLGELAQLLFFSGLRADGEITRVGGPDARVGRGGPH